MAESAQINVELLDDLAERVSRSMLSDRHRLERSLTGIQQLMRQGKPFDRKLSGLQRDLERSEKRYSERAAALPAIDFDPTLPINDKREEIRQALADHSVIVVCGETGSGKSTQLPKICLEAGRGVAGMVGHTQPRRIAARSVAARVSDELNSRLGEAVGFKIRFTDKTSPRTFVKLMTDGILLAETQSDRFLNQYDTIIIDEAHERSLNIDFLLGYLKRLIDRRSDLKVIITSATIDAERFATFFGSEDRPAPVIEVSGRMYPVEIRHQSPVADEENPKDEDIDWQRAVADVCEDLCIEGPGDMLVFMPTERDIRETAKVLRGRSFHGERNSVDIVTLFGRLSEKEQNKVFEPHSGRRIVVATNVAESSLTVPGIRYVVDTGTARISRFSATSQVQRLPIEAISQASANQRAGRCGRVGPGICVRLYSSADFAGRDAYTAPEIQRTNLASVLLQMKALKLGRIEDFPFLDPPAPGAIRGGLKTLFELSALDEQEELTEIGRKLAKLPVDPRIGRMILAADDEQSLEEVLIIASALELRDPRDRPLDKQSQADQAHQQFRHERSDFLSLLKLWDFFFDLNRKLSNSKLRKACQQNFLSYNRMREWKDLHRQLKEIVIDSGHKPTPRRNDEDAIHRAILTGLLSNVAMRGEGHEFTGAGGQKLFLWPGSVAFESKPKWIVAGELVETTRRFARTIAPIQPQWIESLAPHLVKRTYSEPHWSAKNASAMAFEKVLLFGLPVVPRRMIRYGKIDPTLSRDLFLQHGLVEGEYETSAEFARHNAKLKKELEEWQAKLRQGSHFVGEEIEYEFYDQRVPHEVVDGATFEKWRKQAEVLTPRLLFMTREDLLVDSEAAPRQNAFPDTLRVGTMDLPVEYHLEPGSVEDGVTVSVPREGLNQLSEQNLAWLVPGLLEEKVAALMKTLPKSLRILFVPVPETAREIVAKLEYGKGSLLGQLASALRDYSGEHVPETAFEPARLPQHLKMNLRVLDANGKVIASSRDLAELRRQVSQQPEPAQTKGTGASKRGQATSRDDDRWHRDGIRDFSFGELPAQVQLDRQGITVIAYPMLVLDRDSAKLRLSDSPFEAEYHSRRAMVWLFLQLEGKRIQEQVRHFPGMDALTVQFMALPEGKTFQSQLTWRLAEDALFAKPKLPRTEGDWNQQVRQAKQQILVVVQDLAEILPPMLKEANQVRRLLERTHPPALQPLVQDLRWQFARLTRAGFVRETSLTWLRHFPRYFQGMQIRFEKATTGGFQKDRRNQQMLQPFLGRIEQAERQLHSDQQWAQLTKLREFEFLVEEFRVSLFAQQLRCSVPVSEKRLNEAWREMVR